MHVGLICYENSLIQQELQEMGKIQHVFKMNAKYKN